MHPPKHKGQLHSLQQGSGSGAPENFWSQYESFKRSRVLKDQGRGGENEANTFSGTIIFRGAMAAEPSRPEATGLVCTVTAVIKHERWCAVVSCLIDNCTSGTVKKLEESPFWVWLIVHMQRSFLQKQSYLLLDRALLAPNTAIHDFDWVKGAMQWEWGVPQWLIVNIVFMIFFS